MDVDDVSSIEEYFQHVGRQSNLLERASRRKGEVPQNRPSKAALISQFALLSFRHQFSLRQQNITNIRSAFVPTPYSPSTASFRELRKITFQDLRLETHHRGTFLVVKTISPPLRLSGISVAVEDETDSAEVLYPYHQSVDQMHHTFSENQVFLIKEPYYKILADGTYGIRVDHISDLIKLDPEDDRVPRPWRVTKFGAKCANDWKEEGNARLKSERHYEALDCYSKGLSVAKDNTDFRNLRLNRSLLRLRTGQIDGAREDADFILQLYPNDEKALFRLARALFELKLFGASFERFKTITQLYPLNKEAHEWVVRTQLRVTEEQTGQYNYRRLIKSARALHPLLGCASYTNPTDIRPSPGRGRGLFSNRDLKAGDLVLAETAFCYASAEKEGDSRHDVSMLIDPIAKQSTIGTQADLITLIIQKLGKNPSMIPVIRAMFTKDYQPRMASDCEGEPVIDSFMVSKAVQYNVFGCPTISKNDAPDSMFTQSSNEQGSPRVYHSTGLWPVASYINHSCYGNSRRSFLGDLMIIRASQDIPCDTEITFAYRCYTNHVETYDDRHSHLKTWCFECTCDLCVNEALESTRVRRQRKQIVHEIKDRHEALHKKRSNNNNNNNNNNNTNADLLKLEPLLTRLEETYKQPATIQPRHELAECLMAQLLLSDPTNQPGKILYLCTRVLTALGFIIEYDISRSDHHMPLKFAVKRWGMALDYVVDVLDVMLCHTRAAAGPEGLVDAIEEAKRVALMIVTGHGEEVG